MSTAMEPSAVPHGWRGNPLNPEETASTSGSVAAEDVSQISTPESAMAKSHMSQLALSIFPDRTFFVSGNVLTGHIELKSTVNPKHLRLRSIVLEFIGTESVKDQTSSDYVFCKKTLAIQRPDLPPSDAVLVDEASDNQGYWKVKKGTTQLEFAFELPQALASSIVTKYGSIQYQLVLYVTRAI